jgi:PilZ domain
VEDRRRVERQSALWMGLCHIQDEPADLWRECAIIDISTLGVGIDLCHPDPVELLGMWQDGELRLHLSRRITVRLKLGPSIDMTFAGEVRNAGSRPDGIVRAGIEFVGLTEAERSIVDLLTSRAVRTKARVAGGAPDLSVVVNEPTEERLSPTPCPVGRQGVELEVGLQQHSERVQAIEPVAERPHDLPDPHEAGADIADDVPDPVVTLDPGCSDLDHGHGGPPHRREDWIGLAGIPVDVAFRLIPQLVVKFWVRPVVDRMYRAALPVPLVGTPRRSEDDKLSEATLGETGPDVMQHDHGI